MQSEFDELIQRLVEAAQNHASNEFEAPLRDAINALMDSSQDGGEKVIATVCDILPRIGSGCGAAMLSIWLGAMVEQGHAPGESAEAVRNTFLVWARKISIHDGDEVAEGPEAAFHAVDKCAQSLVAHYSRSRDLLEGLLADQILCAEIKRLSNDCAGAMWLDQLMNQTSGDLVVLNMMNNTGAVVRYENLSNCFHLFTLLQGTFEAWLPVSKRPSKAILDSALGLVLNEERDYARWHFGQPLEDPSATESWVWGEASPSTIRSIEEKQIILLWPMVLESRGWGSGFFTPQVQCRPPSVTIVRELSEPEFADWAQRTAPRAQVSRSENQTSEKPWWRFW